MILLIIGKAQVFFIHKPQTDRRAGVSSTVFIRDLYCKLSHFPGGDIYPCQ